MVYVHGLSTSGLYSTWFMDARFMYMVYRRPVYIVITWFIESFVVALRFAGPFRSF
jgi:hypothetical protein